MSVIDWAKLPNHEEFDRIVEAFFVAANRDLDTEAFGVNGRGGDGGIDIHIRRDGRLTIVQLKFFPEGFAGEWGKGRRPQIQRSFKSALAHEPDEWWLVVPTTLTPGERRYVDGLLDKQSSRRRTPNVVAFDRTDLDLLAAAHPDVVTYFKRDELLHAAEVFRAEQALMFHHDDVVARVAAIADQAESLDLDWRTEIFTVDGVTGSRLVAKNAQAATRSPIKLNLKVQFGSAQDDLRLKFERAMLFGAPDRVDLPASVVSNFTVDGPAAFARSEENVELSFLPAESKFVGRPFVLAFYDPDGTHVSETPSSAAREKPTERDDGASAPRRKRVATFPGRTTWASGGEAGASVRVEFYGGAVALEFLLPRDRGKVATVNARFKFGGCDPADVVRAVDMLKRLDSQHAVGLELDGDELGPLRPATTAESVFGAFLESAEFHRDVAADLVFVQAETSRHFNYPPTIEADDRMHLRCLRLLLEGRCIVMPGVAEVSQTLVGGDDNIGSLRTLVPKFPSHIVGQIVEYGIEIFGHEIYLGCATVYSPRVEIVDQDGLLAAIEARRVAGRELTLRTVNGHGFWVYLTDRHTGEADEVVKPSSLGLPHFPDPPDVVRALETAS
ncbi:MAG: hypothetical protein OSB43_12945 [Nocardioides sp.]|uniref:hypothetical protein n=1 Tax=Nocardioides sp. TaxID=35761 RepID=UPI002387688F|nr:hypothetical protein [Nocardioides sp.]MDE0777173.1 hypothetical protein [Nocardioides sp.]